MIRGVPLKQVLRPGLSFLYVLPSRSRLSLQKVCMVSEGTYKYLGHSEPNQHHAHPGSKLQKGGKGDSLTVRSPNLPPQALAELPHSAAVFPCPQMDQEPRDLLYHSGRGRVDKTMG